MNTNSPKHQPTPEQVAAAAPGRYEEIKLSAVTEARTMCERAYHLLAPWKKPHRLRSLRDAIEYLGVEIDRLTEIVHPKHKPSKAPKEDDAASNEAEASQAALDLLDAARKRLAGFKYYPLCQLDSAIQRLKQAQTQANKTETTHQEVCAERGLLASSERDRQKFTVRRTLDGSRREVLHLKAETLMPAAEARQAQGAVIQPESCEVWGSGWAAQERPSAGPAPDNSHKPPPPDGSGPFGPVDGGLGTPALRGDRP